MTLETGHDGTPTSDEVTRITQIADPILRNLRITQAYHEISYTMARLTGAGANWCTFATWASKQAGQTIRREDLLRAFEKLFRISPEITDLAQSLLVHLSRLGVAIDLPLLRGKLLQGLDPRLAFERASDAVARGNLKVFAELAPLFVRFIETFRSPSTTDGAQLQQLSATLRSGQPPDGQAMLAQAFAAYYAARTESDARPQLLFLANLLIGFHEQTRLQPEIAEALDASLGERGAVRERVLAVLYPGHVFQLRRRVARWLGREAPLDAVLDRIIEAAQRRIREVITRHLMTLHLARGEVLRLGSDLPARAFPAELQSIVHDQLREFLARVDLTPESLADSGAQDWADFADRMHFITDYFRCYHDNPGLFENPFTPGQLLDLKAGTVPPPPL